MKTSAKYFGLALRP